MYRDVFLCDFETLVAHLYVRIPNGYKPDSWNLGKIFCPDIFYDRIYQILKILDTKSFVHVFNNNSELIASSLTHSRLGLKK